MEIHRQYCAVVYDSDVLSCVQRAYIYRVKKAHRHFYAVKTYVRYKILGIRFKMQRLCAGKLLPATPRFPSRTCTRATSRRGLATSRVKAIDRPAADTANPLRALWENGALRTAAMILLAVVAVPRLPLSARFMDMVRHDVLCCLLMAVSRNNSLMHTSCCHSEGCLHSLQWSHSLQWLRYGQLFPILFGRLLPSHLISGATEVTSLTTP
jgi:hypothetical protein